MNRLRSVTKFIVIVFGSLLLLLGLLVLALVISNKWDQAQLAERKQYWLSEISQNLPNGTSLDASRQFFGERGITITCSKGKAQICRGRDVEEYGSLPVFRINFRLIYRDGALDSWELVTLGVGL